MTSSKKPIYLTAAAISAGLLSTSAWADIATVLEQGDGSRVTVTGKVKSIDNAREFVLQDTQGEVDVEIASTQSVVFKPGDTVTVSGTLDKGWFSTDVQAEDISVYKSAAALIDDAIEGSPNLSLEGLSSYSIGTLPNEGVVKVSGLVSDVDNEKQFTLNDETGTINVGIESADAAALATGARVTVVGSVDNSMVGKSINATRVIVTADASPEETSFRQ